MNSEVLSTILKYKIIAIVRGVDKSKIIQTVDALVNGGIKNVEIPFDVSSDEGYKNTLTCIETIKFNFKDTVTLGAGTVLTPQAVCDAVQAGAEYIISPNLNREVIDKTKDLDKISMPGAFSPSEVADAYKWGADIVKVFPVGNLGHEYIKALRAPLKHIPMAAVGGVNLDNIQLFLKTGVQAVGIGGDLVDLKAIEMNNFDRITFTAASFCSKIN